MTVWVCPCEDSFVPLIDNPLCLGFAIRTTQFYEPAQVYPKTSAKILQRQILPFRIDRIDQLNLVLP